jgi:NAD+ synthase (glutamine-hydrolysing)
MRIATASLNQTPLDWNRNADNIRCALEWTRKQNTMVICLPELCIPSVGCGRHFKRRKVLDKSLDILFELLPELKDMIVTLGLPLEFEGNIFNAVCLAVDGKPFGFQLKTNFSDGNLTELGWFRPWPRHQHTTFELNGETYKIGDLSFEFNLNESKTFHVAVEIGEPDWNTPQAPAASQRQKVDLLLNPAASCFSFEKHARRLRFAETVTKEHHSIHAVANYVGNESGPLIYDGGSFIAANGKIVAATPRFSYHDAQVAAATLDSENTPSDTVTDSFGKEDELSRAVPLGMLDYLRKSGAKGFALSISGGADSASLAAFTSLGILFAQQELGTDGFSQQFGFVPGVTEAKTPQEILNKMLVCFYQGSKNSSETTRNAAETVAVNLGAEFHELRIDRFVDDYVDLVSKSLGRELTWEQDAIALQNIQARVRVPSAWLFANAGSRILLATGNRSEGTLGYTTMDGDTCGSVGPIAGVDKTFLRNWIRWMQTVGPEVGRKRVTFSFLHVISDQQPTAELYPGQTDEGDLMPYTVLNRIEQLGLAQNKPETEILSILKQEFTEFSETELTEWIDRFYKIWMRNQWKRTRYAMGFHLDDSTLTGDAWRQFPVLAGKDD